MKSIFISLIVLSGGSAMAVTELVTSQTNPAQVSAVLTKSCADIHKTIDEKFSNVTEGLPFIQNIELIKSGDWVTSLKSEYDLSASRKTYYSYSSTLGREFPQTIFTMNHSKFECLKAKGVAGEDCKSSYTTTINGSDALIYQKQIELGRSKKFLDSFSYSISLTERTKDTCQVASSFSILNTSYLWAKKHLVGDVKPETIEANLLNKFVSWQKSSLARIEEQP